MLILSHWWIYPIVWIPNIYLFPVWGHSELFFMGTCMNILCLKNCFLWDTFEKQRKLSWKVGTISDLAETETSKVVVTAYLSPAAAFHPHEQLVFSVLKFKAFWWGLICLTLTIREVSIWLHLLAIGKSSVAYTGNKWAIVYRSSLYILFLCLLLNISITVNTFQSLDRIFIHLLESLLR